MSVVVGFSVYRITEKGRQRLEAYEREFKDSITIPPLRYWLILDALSDGRWHTEDEIREIGVDPGPALPAMVDEGLIEERAAMRNPDGSIRVFDFV